MRSRAFHSLALQPTSSIISQSGFFSTTRRQTKVPKTERTNGSGEGDGCSIHQTRSARA